MGWQPDTESSRCRVCNQELGGLSFRRRHHCRFCGYVVCRDCSNYRTTNPISRTQEDICEMCRKDPNNSPAAQTARKTIRDRAEQEAAAAAAAEREAEEKARIEQAQQAAAECLDQAVAFCVDEESKLVTELRGVIDQADIQTSIAKTMQKLSLMSKEELDDWVAKEMTGSPIAMMANRLDQQTLLGLIKANPEKVDAAKAEFITRLKSQVKELGEKWEANQDELLEKVAKCFEDIQWRSGSDCSHKGKAARDVKEAEIAAYKHLWAEGILQSTTCPPGFRIEQSDAVDARCKAGDHENGCLARIAMRYAPSAQSDTVSLIKQFEKAWDSKANAL